MRTYTEAELKEILRKHRLWLYDDPKGERANLYGADLTRADLTRADLTRADLTLADLTLANLTGANLTRADLTLANLTGANLTRANLTRADFYGAYLYGADFTGADFTGADFTGANLYGANHLDDAINVNLPIACPEKGSFIGFKKVRGGYIVELEIPEDAMRSSATTRKCRCSHAKVLSITNIDGTPADVDVVYSSHDCDFAYRVGEIIKPDSFDPNRWNECAPGIHFFITRTEAMYYLF